MDEMKVSERGFLHGDAVVGSFGSSVRVYESSNAEMASIWVSVKQKDPYSNEIESCSVVELPISEAKQLLEQLTYLIKNVDLIEDETENY